jgi:hypothetical protein
MSILVAVGAREYDASRDASACKDGEAVEDSLELAADEAVRGSDATGGRVSLAEADAIDVAVE